MTISVQDLITAIEMKNGFPLNANQKNAIRHGQGPLLLIAGPGTGKTEVLVVRCLKLICCDGVAPGSIMVTTFTEKAARNLEERIAEAMMYVEGLHPKLQGIDISQLRIGTLHGLCNEILQEFRYTEYQNLRLLDDIGAKMLIRDKLAKRVRDNQRQLHSNFRYLFGNNPSPNLWDWTKALQKLLDRLVDDQIDISALRAAGGPWAELADVNDMYEQILAQKYFCDFSRLQRHFLNFLSTPQGDIFLKGDGTPQRPPLLYVLVDEYQDTNPIQEQIYFSLTDRTHNITVVGDDDQALYRFRGGTVECMVGFESRCQGRWGIQPTKIPLNENHRSHERIIKWCNEYINSFSVMRQPNARVQGKPNLQYASGPNGSYPAVSVIREPNLDRVAQSFADTVEGLYQNGIIQDYNQCVLLLRSTKETPRNAAKYIAALRGKNIPVYNPRSNAFLDQSEVQEVLGAFISILDPGLQTIRTIAQPGIVEMVNQWVEAYRTVSSTNPNLEAYVRQAQATIQATAPGTRLTPAAPTILYRILAHEPFSSYQLDPVRDLRLSKLTRLLEAFCSQAGRELFADTQRAGVVNQWWLSNFYYVFCGYLESYGMDEDEDDEVVCPRGMFPIMTIHQSKGLEFDFVFVGSLGSAVSVGDAQMLEEALRPFRATPPTVIHPIDQAAWHDEIRLHFVAYSRAKYALVLLATNSQLRKTDTASFGDPSAGLVQQYVQRL